MSVFNLFEVSGERNFIIFGAQITNAMKKIVALFTAIFLSLSMFAADLVLIYTSNYENTCELFADESITVHYYTDDFVIASAQKVSMNGAVVLSENAFEDPDMHYFLLWLDPERQPANYIQEVETHANILCHTREFLVVSANLEEVVNLYPAIHGGMVAVTPRAAQLAEYELERGTLSYRADIETMLGEVDEDSLQAKVQHLENYGTRNAYSPEAVLAQNWIFDKFASYGLDVELHDFSMPGGAASDNVVATLTGSKYPDEYVVLGAHYDSYSYSGSAPGADDNATGTAGILEAARIMSQYTFDRSIIFATWGGEEYGLYGSEAWASEAADNGMNILGYFNMDMAGYLAPGQEIHTDIIAPPSANELRQFYKDVCAIYLPDFQVDDGALSGGDSDHTSFNQNGYMGIFPFEDSQNYSPYIHTSNDIIGPSVNNFEQHATFTKAIIANVSTMADRLPAPSELVATAGDAEVLLSWSGIDSVDHYNIYRDNDTAPYDSAYTTDYIDTNVVNGTTYEYFITAVFADTGEESDPSNEVTATPMPPIALPFFEDYETGAPYWTFESDWGLYDGIYHSVSHSLTESPNGEYYPNMNASATLRALDLTGAISAELSFWVRYRIENNYDFMHLEISTDGSNWDLMESYTGNQYNWAQESFSLDDYIDESSVLIRFRFESDSYVEDQGMFIDDLEVILGGVGIADDLNPSAIAGLKIRPNPAYGNATVNFNLDSEGEVSISLINILGKTVKEIANQYYIDGGHRLDFNVSELPQGTYLLLMTFKGERAIKRLMIQD
jgi:hypothetical protein